MDLPTALVRQLQYDTWANQELLGFLVGCDLVPPQAWTLYDHVLGTSATWLARLRGEAPTLAVWPELAPDARPQHLTALARGWRETLAAWDAEALDERVRYRNTAGTEYTTRRLDVVQHVLLHAHYHRGQVASTLRRAGVDPPWVDPIVWTRLFPDA